MQDLTADMRGAAVSRQEDIAWSLPPFCPARYRGTSDPARLTSFAEILERINGVQIGPGATALTRIFRIVPPYRRRVFTYHVRFSAARRPKPDGELKDRKIG